METLTVEQIEDKAAKLSTSLGVDVTPIIQTDKKTGEQIVGYLKECDDFNVLIVAVGKYLNGNVVEACEVLLPYCLIREESSPRILSIDKKDIKVKVGAITACVPLIDMYANEYKKK